MTRYYFYSSAKDELQIIEAESLDDFATHQYNPSLMKFTGVAVEAEDFESALKVYSNPSCGEGEYMMSDEPPATVTQRQLAGIQESFDVVKFKLEYLRAYLKMKAACLHMQQANRLLNEASQELFQMHNRPKEMTTDVIFKKLSDTALEHIKYYGDTKKS